MEQYALVTSDEQSENLKSAAAKNRLHTLYEKLQERIAVDLRNARDANEDPNAKGEASEGTWLQLLTAYLPHRYRVMKGIIIDCNGEESDAIDVIIHDRQYTPAIYQQFGLPYVPAESVYAVFEAKQQLNKAHVEYAGAKAASVRKLYRTSATIPFAAGTYPKKDPPRILAGILTFESDWNPAFGESFNSSIAGLTADHHLDLGIATARGCFEVRYGGNSPQITIFKPERALAAFLIRLLARLQALGTAPAIDYDEYGRMLEIEEKAATDVAT
jgi:hypothetical protein